MLAPEAGLLSEREAAIGQIERNRIITKFFLKKRPEKRMLAVRRETMMVVWFKVQGSRNEFEGAVDIREIKEVRKTRNSREFDKTLENSKTLSESTNIDGTIRKPQKVLVSIHNPKEPADTNLCRGVN